MVFLKYSIFCVNSGIELQKQMSEMVEDRLTNGVSMAEATQIPGVGELNEKFFSDEVPEDWDENMSDFDYDEVTRSWMDQSRIKPT
jgi:hypothetical protein